MKKKIQLLLIIIVVLSFVLCIIQNSFRGVNEVAFAIIGGLCAIAWSISTLNKES